MFGAYTHCSWPLANGVVGDPTGKSFLFSLVNASGKAARFSLRENDRAIQLADCVCFGACNYEDGKPTATAYPNVLLMFNGQAADEKGGNCANRVNAGKAYQSDDDGAVCDHTFLAGQQLFAAEQIEVYQL